MSELRAARIGRRHRWYLPFKSFIAWMIALILFVITVPLMAALGAIVRLTSPGPAFYSQPRVGPNGWMFLMHKLRSMRHNCEAETGPRMVGAERCAGDTIRASSAQDASG